MPGHKNGQERLAGGLTGGALEHCLDALGYPCKRFLGTFCENSAVILAKISQ